MKRLLEADAYVTGEMDDAAADAFEQALFDAPEDPDVELLDRLARHGARLAKHGTFDMGATRAQIDKLRSEGVRIQDIDLGPPGEVVNTAVIDANTELVSTRLVLGRTDLPRVDVEILLVPFNVTKLILDAVVDTTDGNIYALCEPPLAHMAFTAGETIARVFERGGQRKLVAEWHVHIGAAPA